DPWARRRFALCARAGERLPAAAALLADYLARRGGNGAEARVQPARNT
ncbi:LysR family transcriptional regulator, partial [Paracidovorax cattleyae]